MDFYYFSLCHVCKQAHSNLKMCANCKVVHYCSREHQAQDWPKHKEICKAIGRVNKVLSLPDNATSADLNQLKYSSSALWQTELRRSLTLAEHHMWMFPKMCPVCYKKETHFACEDCLSVSYCCEEHRDRHRDEHGGHCGELKLCLLLHQNVFNENLKLDWVRFKISSEIEALPGTLEALFAAMGHPKPKEFSADHVNYICMAEFFVPAINMIFALEQSGFIANRRGKKVEITVHVVGPDVSEHNMSWSLILEYLAHWIKNLKSVTVFLVGPRVTDNEAVYLTFNCEECTTRGFRGVVAGLGALYHEIAPILPKPDLIVALNSGLHEFSHSFLMDSWRESVPKLVKFRKVPTMLTAYTEDEIIKDVERFEGMNIRFIVKPQRNPYANLRPIRNWEEGTEPIFYQNMFVTVIAKN